jgi:hypothetical protein
MQKMQIFSEMVSVELYRYDLNEVLTENLVG